MTTIQKMKDAEKAALQNELEYYSGLLAAHYSSIKMPSQHPNVPSAIRRNPTNSIFKTTTNQVHYFKSTSYQSKNVVQFPNQNLKTRPHFNPQKKIISTDKVSNSFNLKKYPFKSNMVKVNPPGMSLNHVEKPLECDLLKKNLHSKQTIPCIVNKPSGSNSQVLMNEISQLIKQLKQKTKNIDSKINDVYLQGQLLNKCILDKQELKATIKVPTDSKISCSTLTNQNQTIDLKDAKYNICSSREPALSKKPKLCMLNRKEEIPELKLCSMDASFAKPLIENSFMQQSNNKIPHKVLKENSVQSTAKFESVDVLSVNTTIKTPFRKKLIKKHSPKKLNGVTLFASKYKVVNRKLPYVQKKDTLVTTEAKTPLKMKLTKKHINTVKKTKGVKRLISTKYKIINKKSPSVQTLNFENSLKKREFCKLPIDNPLKKLKTGEIKPKTVKLSSKYKIVNKNEKSVPVPTSFAKKNIHVKESRLGSFMHQENIFNKFNSSNSRKCMYITSKLHGDRKMNKSIGFQKQNHLHVLSLKRKKHNSLISGSKYKTVNKQSNSLLEKGKFSDLNCEPNSSVDLDLLMELAAEKKYNSIANTSNKHILIKRVYKSKNAIVNKNICSLQSKAAKMIKTKYSILNKKHSWQSISKRLISPKPFKGHNFNSIYQKNRSFFHNQRNKRNNTSYKSQHASTYFAKRTYSRNYLVSKSSNNAVGSFSKTPKRFVFNRKVHLNTMKSIAPTSKTIASRALNRSINRVLTASVKKTSKVNVYCMFYNRFGRCNNGIKCTYVHDPSKIAVCTRFLRGTCKTENCPFSHEICPGKMAICSFFLLGSCTKIDCPYRHETLSPDAKLCKAFVQGYCPSGKQCKQAHVLICPQIVQGHCDKGVACPFPHPPTKEKKTIPISTKKSENLEADELIEKMSRYFECANESLINNKSGVNSIAVPRIRNLPEQPSFIAL